MSDYVQIQVPQVHYRDMLSHLVSLMTEASGKTPVPKETPVPQATRVLQEGLTDRDWREDEWEKVWPAVREDTRRIMVLLAENQGEWVPMDAVEDLLGSFGAAQGSFSSFTKRLRKLGKTKWPFEIERDDRTGRLRYLMHESTAAIVLRLARENGPNDHLGTEKVGQNDRTH